MMGGLDGMRRLLEGNVSKPKNLWATLQRFGAYFAQYRGALLLIVIFILISTWAQVTVPDLAGQAVDCYLFPQPGRSTCWFGESATAIDQRIQADQSISAGQKAAASLAEKIGGLARLCLTLLVLALGSAAITGMAFYTMTRTGQNVLRQLREDLFAHLQRLSIRYYTENEAGNIMSRITSDSDAIAQALNFALISVASGFLLMLWIGFRMLQTDLAYALISLSITPLIALATVYFSGQARKAFRKSRQQMGSVNADLQESIAGVREAQAFSREEENIAEFVQVNAANRDANIRAASFTAALTPTLEALGYLSIAVVVVVGGLMVFRNQPLVVGGAVVSLGVVFAFVQYVQRFNQPIQQIATLWTNIQNAIAGGERIFGLMDVQPDLIDRPDAKPMPAIQGRVEFVEVHAEYQKGEPVLKGISFTAEQGQVIAIVGPTGAGKTTIINLIPRFYDVTQGAVRIDGIDVRDVTMESLRRQIGVVLQDTYLFSDTVMNNIRYGRLEASDEEVMAAARLVAADTFIERLPEGYQTILGERGSGLSQGQRQLLSIARAALKDPRILILDEATSSVDTRTERLIQKALEKLLAGRTSFVIAHRLSTIRNADQVLFVSNGEIIERGTHTTLLEKRGAYYDLYMSQFRRQDETAASVNGAGAFTNQPATGIVGD